MALLMILNVALVTLIIAIILKARNSVKEHHKNMELLHGMIRDVIAINRSQADEAELSEELEQKMKRVKTRLLTDIEELIREFLNLDLEKKK